MDRSSPHIDRLLQSLVKNLGDVPEYAEVVHDYSELPFKLRNVIVDAIKAGHSWCCWAETNFHHIWLFIAEMSLPLSRERGTPVLRLRYYRDYGLRESATWVIDRQAKWHRWEISIDVDPDAETLPAFSVKR
jgi:hypothetical protein